MSSGPAKYEESAERKKPKPSCKISKTPPPKISLSPSACAFKIAKIMSCLRVLARFSSFISAARLTNSLMDFSFSSVRFIGGFLNYFK